MDYSSYYSRSELISRRLEFANTWCMDDESKDHDDDDDTPPFLWEPCSYQNVYTLLPIELFGIDASILTSEIFNMDTWNSLDEKDRDALKILLPSGSDEYVQNVLKQLFGGCNFKFGNPLEKFVADLLNGEYNAYVQQYKTQIDNIERYRQSLYLKTYYSQTLRSILDYKRKIGLKVEDNLLDYLRDLPDANDIEEKRELKRIKKNLIYRCRKHKKEKQLASLINIATKIAASDPAFTPGNSGDSDDPNLHLFALALAEIGIRMPKQYQYDYPIQEDYLFYSDKEDYLSDETASLSDEQEELDVIEEDLDTNTANNTNISINADNFNNTTTSITNSNTKKSKKRIREETSDSLLKKEMKAAKRKERRRKISLFNQEVFNFFSSIRSILENVDRNPVPFQELLSQLEVIPKIKDSVPCGYTLESMLILALKILSKPPKEIYEPILQTQIDPNSVNSKMWAFVKPLHPISDEILKNIINIDNNNSTTTTTNNTNAIDSISTNGTNNNNNNNNNENFNNDSKNKVFLENSWIWCMDPSSPMVDRLDALETMFFFFLTRERFFNEGKTLTKMVLTLENEPPEHIQQVQEQEAKRYANPEVPFVFNFTDPPKGHNYTICVGPLRNSGSTLRPHTTLKQDRPPYASLLALVKDAVCRLPGGVGTRPDVVHMLKNSQYILENLEITQLNNAVSGALDRLHSEFDPCVRFDNDLKLWINLHRLRLPEDFLKARMLEEKTKALEANNTLPLLNTVDPACSNYNALSTLGSFIEI